MFCGRKLKVAPAFLTLHLPHSLCDPRGVWGMRNCSYRPWSRIWATGWQLICLSAMAVWSPESGVRSPSSGALQAALRALQLRRLEIFLRKPHKATTATVAPAFQSKLQTKMLQRKRKRNRTRAPKAETTTANKNVNKGAESLRGISSFFILWRKKQRSKRKGQKKIKLKMKCRSVAVQELWRPSDWRRLSVFQSSSRQGVNIHPPPAPPQGSGPHHPASVALPCLALLMQFGMCFPRNLCCIIAAICWSGDVRAITVLRPRILPRPFPSLPSWVPRPETPVLRPSSVVRRPSALEPRLFRAAPSARQRTNNN